MYSAFNDGRWSFWSWFDVNRSIFDDDSARKNVVLFSFPVTLTFSSLICSPSYSCRALFPLNWKFLWLFYFEKIGGTVTGGLTDGQGATLSAKGWPQVLPYLAAISRAGMGEQHRHVPPNFE